ALWALRAWQGAQRLRLPTLFHVPRWLRRSTAYGRLGARYRAAESVCGPPIVQLSVLMPRSALQGRALRRISWTSRPALAHFVVDGVRQSLLIQPFTEGSNHDYFGSARARFDPRYSRQRRRKVPREI